MSEQSQNQHQKHLVAALPLLAIGFLASFGFLYTVEASGISTGEVISLANKSRANASLAPLTENEILSRAAKAKAKDMIENDYFAHTSPKGATPWHWIKKEGYQYKYAGENLAINYTSAKDQHNAWMKSSSHRDNILNANYKEIGVAVVEGKIDGESSIVTVELFGTPLHAAVGSKPAVKSAETETAPAPVEAAVPAPEQPVLDQSMNTAPVLLEALPPLPASDTLLLDRVALLMFFLLAFSLVAPPVALLSRVYARLVPEKRPFPGKKLEELPSVPQETFPEPLKKTYKVI